MILRSYTFCIKRQCTRVLKIRNLLALTIVLMFFYILKSQGYTGSSIISAQQSILRQNKYEYFYPTSLEKIDWHDYNKIEEEAKRTGVGEQGKPATMPADQKKLEKDLYSVNGFNGALSDLISLNRSLNDIRHPLCKTRKYIESLPTVSVVVPFHNEHWSTLLRTAQSVLNRSPEHLIKEIFLVDDASTKEFLKDKLDNYLKENMPKVKTLRLEKRSGLITARLKGAKHATGDVIIFLDSHTEANVNWLPPLLEPIALNYRCVVCPFIDVIAYDTFEYRAQDEGARGAFDWEFFYKRLPVLPADRARMPEPFESPVMAGGLFAISRVFFWELGGYDPGLDIWGGEQYELSFKIWQCGGRMVDAPCSRVGHIYRKFAPFPNPGHGDFVGKNYRRVAEVWMDEYAEHLYARRPHYRNIATGDISEQKALRQRLNCKPFKWFMHKVAFDLTAKYPVEEPKPFGNGRVRPEGEPALCVDAAGGGQLARLQLTSCTHTVPDRPEPEQHFVLSWYKDVKLSSRNMCWDVADRRAGRPVTLYTCHLGGGNQAFRYYTDTKQIRPENSEYCLDYDVSTRDLFVNPCQRFAQTQRWIIDHLDREQLANWDNISRNHVTGPLDY